MATWSAPAFLDAFKAGLELRPGLSGVTVFTAHPGDDEQPMEGIVLHSVRGRQEGARFGPSNDEDYVCEGYVVSIKPGAGEVIVKQARDRAKAIFAEIEAFLIADEHVSATVGYARVGAFDLVQNVSDRGRWSRIEFDIPIISIL